MFFSSIQFNCPLFICMACHSKQEVTELFSPLKFNSTLWRLPSKVATFFLLEITKMT